MKSTRRVFFDSGRVRRLWGATASSRERVKKDSLLTEHKDARLAGKTNFLDLAALTDEYGVVNGFSAAVFPAPFGFGNHFAALFDRGFVAVNEQAILACRELSFAELGGLRQVNVFGKR